MKVLIATDGSDAAVAAARSALALLAPPDAVLVACIVEPPTVAAEGFESGFAGGVASPEEIEAAWSGANEQAHGAVTATVEALDTDAEVEVIAESGDVGPMLAAIAEEQGCDVIVVGSRGHGAIRRALLGSVSTHLVQHAPCPVFVVREGAGED